MEVSWSPPASTPPLKTGIIPSCDSYRLVRGDGTASDGFLRYGLGDVLSAIRETSSAQARHFFAYA